MAWLLTSIGAKAAFVWDEQTTERVTRKNRSYGQFIISCRARVLADVSRCNRWRSIFTSAITGKGCGRVQLIKPIVFGIEERIGIICLKYLLIPNLSYKTLDMKCGDRFGEEPNGGKLKK